MFCTKCGKNIKDTASFCTNCGSKVGDLPVQQQYAPAQQPAGYAPPKKSKKGLVIGLIAGGVVVLAAALLTYFFLLRGPNADVAGKWYDSEGYAGEFELFADNTWRSDVLDELSEEYTGTYTYDAKTKKGRLTVDEWGVKQSSNAGSIKFEYKDNKLILSDVGILVKTAVEQTDKNALLKPGFDTEYFRLALLFDRNALIAGKWYDEYGYSTIEFLAGGKCNINSMGFELSGTYTFDDVSKNGEVTMSFYGMTETQKFTLNDDGTLDFDDGLKYTRTPVDPVDFSDMFGDYDFGDYDFEDYYTDSDEVYEPGVEIANAKMVAQAINVHNTLYPDNMIINVQEAREKIDPSIWPSDLPEDLSGVYSRITFIQGVAVVDTSR